MKEIQSVMVGSKDMCCVCFQYDSHHPECRRANEPSAFFPAGVNQALKREAGPFIDPEPLIDAPDDEGPEAA